MYDCLGNFMKTAKKSVTVIPNAKVGGGNVPSVTQSSSIVWDPTKSGGGIAITENGAQCFLK